MVRCPRLVLSLVLAACAEPPVPVIVVPPPPSPAVSVAAPVPPLKPPAPPVVEPEGPAAPPVRPIDPALKVDFLLLLGENDKEAWVTTGEQASIVIDKATGCATESYPDPPALGGLRKNLPPGAGLRPENALAGKAVLDGIRSLVGLGRRFHGQGHRFILDMSWSPNGRHITVTMHGRIYRSSDGGQTFAPLDPKDVGSSRPAMSPDGKHLVYQRCDNPSTCDYVSLALDGSRPFVPLTKGQTFMLRMSPPGSRVYFWRSDPDICLDSFDLATGTKEKSFCVPSPPNAVGPWPSREWLSVSPNGHYGIVKWNEHRKNLAGVAALTDVASLVDLQSGKTLKTVTDLEGEVDDDGDMVLHAMSEGGGDHTYLVPMSGPKKLLGNHSLLSYTNKTALMAVSHKSPGALGSRKCDLVKLVKVPN